MGDHHSDWDLSGCCDERDVVVAVAVAVAVVVIFGAMIKRGTKKESKTNGWMILEKKKKKVMMMTMMMILELMMMMIMTLVVGVASVANVAVFVPRISDQAMAGENDEARTTRAPLLLLLQQQPQPHA